MTSIGRDETSGSVDARATGTRFSGSAPNILVNMLVLTGLLRSMLKMPDSLVFGRILPALGLMILPLTTMYYAFLAYRLALKTGRSDVCALPSGVSVPHMFIVDLRDHAADHAQDQRSGQGLGEPAWSGCSSRLHPDDRRLRRSLYPQDHAARGAARHARRRLDHLHLDAAGARNVHDADHRADLLRHHPGELVRRLQIPEGIPAGLVAIAVGMLIAWGSNLFGLGYGGLEPAEACATRSRASASRCRSRPSTTCSPASSSSA